MTHVCATFNYLYPKLSLSGIYMVEDLHTAYWQEYEGGYRRAGTFIELCKDLIDQLNADHARGQPAPIAFSTLSMHFYDSVVVFERGRHTENSRRRLADQRGLDESGAVVLAWAVL